MRYIYIYIHTHTHTHDSGLVTKSCSTLATPWTVTCQAPHSIPKPGIEPGSPALQVDTLPADLPRKPIYIYIYIYIYI